MNMLPQLGQTLWLNFTNRHKRGDLRPFKITKIGHKWLTVGNEGYPESYRVAISDFSIDGGQYSSLGKAYISEAAYHTEKALTAAWEGFRNAVQNTYYAPAHTTLEAIQEAVKVLGMTNNVYLNFPKEP